MRDGVVMGVRRVGGPSKNSPQDPKPNVENVTNNLLHRPLLRCRLPKPQTHCFVPLCAVLFLSHSSFFFLCPLPPPFQPISACISSVVIGVDIASLMRPHRRRYSSPNALCSAVIACSRYSLFARSSIDTNDIGLGAPDDASNPSKSSKPRSSSRTLQYTLTFTLFHTRPTTNPSSLVPKPFPSPNTTSQRRKPHSISCMSCVCSAIVSHL